MRGTTWARDIIFDFCPVEQMVGGYKWYAGWSVRPLG